MSLNNVSLKSNRRFEGDYKPMTKKYSFLCVSLLGHTNSALYALRNPQVAFMLTHRIWFSCNWISILPPLQQMVWPSAKVELMPPTTRSAMLCLNDTKQRQGQKYSASYKLFQICCLGIHALAEFARLGIASLYKWSARLHRCLTILFTFLLLISDGNCQVWLPQVPAWHFFSLSWGSCLSQTWPKLSFSLSTEHLSSSKFVLFTSHLLLSPPSPSVPTRNSPHCNQT